MEKIASFIDGAYLDKVSRAAGAGIVDLDALSKRLAGHCQLLRTYFYDCLPYVARHGAFVSEDQHRFEQKDRFLTDLSYVPNFCIRLGQLAFRGCDQRGRRLFVQKRVDVYQAVDLVVLAAKGLITHAAVVAGDSDVIPAIEAAQAEGVIVHLFHGESTHRDLLALCDQCTQMDAAFLSQLRR